MAAALKALAFAIGAFLLIALPRSAAALEPAGDETELGPIFLLSLGGKLYDDAWRVLDQAAPDGRNPAIPAGSDMPPHDTWRCVSCHGWSYSGAEIDGRTFPGLLDLAGVDADEIGRRIADAAHPFPASDLPPLALQLLAIFLGEGLGKRADFLDDRGQALGNPEFGRDIYEGACINCHQLDGRRFLHGERGDRSSLGWVARNRPEQALHKIINGVPAAEMLSLRFLSAEAIADLLAYIQSLDPVER